MKLGAYGTRQAPRGARRRAAGGLVQRAALALALCAAGCAGAPAQAPAEPVAPPAAPQRPFYEGTEAMRASARQAIADFERPEGTAAMDASARLARLGEPAVPPLLEALRMHPSARTRGMSAYTLGFLRDRRALEPLAQTLADRDRPVQLEAATALLRLGDDRGLVRLVDALEDRDAAVRSRAIGVLQEAVGSTWGYGVSEAPEDRAAAVARWRSWLQQRREGRP
ncbi:MAG: HEAT repeat domain-containing protein [Planctomycetia bacterium]